MLRDEQFGFRHGQEFRRKKVNRGGDPRRGQGLLYRVDRRPPLQFDYPQLPVVSCTCHLVLSSGLDVRGALPDGHVIPSRHAGWSSAMGVNLPCSLQSVCQRHTHTIAPRRSSSLRIGHGHQSHVSKPTLLGSFLASPQQPSTLAEGVKDRHKHIQELSDHLRTVRTAIQPNPTTDNLRGANQMARQYSFSFGDRR